MKRSFFPTVIRFGLAAALITATQRHSAWAGASAEPGLTTIQLTAVDPDTTGYATFQSYNHKVVQNRRGIFMTVMKTFDPPYLAQTWQLWRSGDGGKTFGLLYSGEGTINAPQLETDEADNLYVGYPNYNAGKIDFYRFLASENYQTPHKSQMTSDAAGKSCMAYDPIRGRFYFWSHGGRFHMIGKDGRQIAARQLTRADTPNVLQYPMLYVSSDGVLHAAWTTSNQKTYLYWSIHYMKSLDGGQSWQTMSGNPIAEPFVSDDTGPADLIVLRDEFNVHTWLSSFVVRSGKAHFAYWAQAPLDRMHYVRYDTAKATREIDTAPRFMGETLSIKNLDGYFSLRQTAPGTTIYYISQTGGRLACLASDDDGQTWYDYARGSATRLSNPYSIAGGRELTPDGWIIGHFTDFNSADAGKYHSGLYFFKIQAGLARVDIDAIWRKGDAFGLRFKNVRGQPELIRFQLAPDPRSETDWTSWMEFSPDLSVPLPRAPIRYQLRSRLDVIADPVDLPIFSSTDNWHRYN